MDYTLPCLTLTLPGYRIGYGAPYQVLVPPKATVITTPLHPCKWQEMLSAYPNKALTEFFITGLLYGFKISFNNPPSQLHSARKNLFGALQYPEVVDDYLKVEIAEHRVIGPFLHPSCPYKPLPGHPKVSYT